MIPFPNAGYVPGPGEMPGYQNLSGYFVPAGTGIQQFQHMQGIGYSGNDAIHLRDFKAPPTADYIARNAGPPVSKSLPYGQMTATPNTLTLGPRGPLRGLPLG